MSSVLPKAWAPRTYWKELQKYIWNIASVGISLQRRKLAQNFVIFKFKSEITVKKWTGVYKEAINFA